MSNFIVIVFSFVFSLIGITFWISLYNVRNLHRMERDFLFICDVLKKLVEAEDQRLAQQQKFSSRASCKIGNL